MAENAVAAGLRLLGRRPYTAFELKAALLRREHPEEEVDAAIRRIQDLGYLDDLDAAKATVRYRQRTPRGRRAVAAELYRRGVSSELVQEALEGFDEQEGALALGTRKKGQGRTREQIGRSLGSRGFSPSTIARVLESLFPAGEEAP